jgi:hypothetical protein
MNVCVCVCACACAQAGILAQVAARVARWAPLLDAAAGAVAELDCLVALAQASCFHGLSYHIFVIYNQPIVRVGWEVGECVLFSWRSRRRVCLIVLCLVVSYCVVPGLHLFSWHSRRRMCFISMALAQARTF